MPAYKDKKTGLFYVQFYYRDARGAKRHKTKKGFQTELEALLWEKNFKVLASILFSPFPPMYLRRSRHRSFADPANADAPLPASLAPPSRRLRRATRPSGGTTARLSL